MGNAFRKTTPTGKMKMKTITFVDNRLLYYFKQKRENENDCVR